MKVNIHDPQNDADRLAVLMAECSEDCYCAGWMSGLEFDLWGAVLRGTDFDWGQSTVKAETLAEMKRLAESCDGWPTWPDDVRGGPVLSPMSEWIETYNRRTQNGR